MLLHAAIKRFTGHGRIRFFHNELLYLSHYTKKAWDRLAETRRGGRENTEMEHMTDFMARYGIAGIFKL